MKKIFPDARHKWHRGLTLMESVVAMGVIAVAVPLMLSATAMSTRTRTKAEADTRSAWLAREVQRELTQAWRGRPSEMFPQQPAFPQFASEQNPEVLLFDLNGRYLARCHGEDWQQGLPQGPAHYMVLLHAVARHPANITSGAAEALSLVQIRVSHTARASRGKRMVYDYTILIPRQTVS